MSFVTDIIGPISSAFKTVFGVGKAVVGGVSDFLDATGISSLLAIVTTLTNNIDSLVNEVSGTLKAIVDPITSVVDSVSHLATDIQDKIVAPIITPITTTITEIHTLTGTIGRLVDEGIGGIIKIPGAISDALTGISGAFDRSSRQLADAQGQIVVKSLVPGFEAFIAPGLQGITDASLKFSSPKNLAIGSPFAALLSDNPDLKLVSDKVSEAIERYKNPKEIWDHIGAIALDIVSLGPLILGFFESQYEEAVEAGRAANPVTTLGVADILNAFQRKLISAQQSLDELAKHGYDDSRRKLLLESTRYVPSIGDASAFLQRGLISEQQYRIILERYGMSDDDIAATRAAINTTISPGLAVDWLARGIIDTTAFDDNMRAQGYTKDQIAHYIRGSLSPPDVGIAINAQANQTAGSRSWFPETYLSLPPDEVTSAGRAARIDPDAIDDAWQSHFSVMPISMAVALFFRGEMNRNEVRIVVEQNSFPPAMTDLFITSQSELINSRSIPALIKSGRLSETEGRERLAQRGFQTADIDILVADAVQAFKDGVAPEQTDVTKLTVAQLGAAYKEGVLDEATYRDLLATHGLVGNDIEITVQLANYDIIKSLKKDIADTLKAEVQLGVKTPDEAVQTLFEQGFTGPEVERLAVTMQQTKQAAAKLPSLADMTRMIKKGLIDQEVYLAGIQALGYGPPWDTLYVALNIGSADDGSTDSQS